VAERASAVWCVKNDPIAILFDRLGPYHWARLQAAARLFRVVAVETCAITREHQWERIEEPPAFDRVTLFDDISDGGGPKGTLLRQKMAKSLHEADPAVAMIPGWGTPASLIALEWCLQHQRPAVVMSESNAFDEKRFAFAESIKRIVVSLFSAGLAGGKLPMEYLIALGLPRDRVFTGYDVVDNEYFRRNAEALRSQASEVRRKYGLPRNYFLASARFVPKKNLPTLIRAYARYRQLAANKDGGQPPTDNGRWDLVLVGDGPLRAVLCRLISDLRLGGHVHLPGFVQYRELPAYYALADVFVHASITEQWGLVVNEAMATGLPVIVSNRCGCVPDLVAEGKNGLTFDPRSVKNLSKLMLDMWRLPKGRLEEMRQESRRIIAGFTPADFATGAQRAIDVAKAAPIRRTSLFSSLLLKTLIRR
jgi:1,2-diacylglycerol 3-alpha-glucosyltransferase